MASCYKDKSISEFKTINEFTIKEVKKDYGDLVYKRDTLKIKPVIESTKENQKYTYLWMLYQKQTSSGGGLVFDTISREKDLIYSINEKKGVGQAFFLLFEVKNQETGIVKFLETKFNKLTIMSRGWYILKDNNSITDIDFFTKVDFSNKMPNIINKNNYSFPGKALSLSFARDAVTWTMNGYYRDETIATCIVPVSDESMSFISINEENGIKEFLNYDVLFDVKPVNNAPFAFINSKGKTQLAINDNKVYKANFSTSRSWLGRASLGFGHPIPTSQEISSDLELSKHFLTTANGNSVFFDKKSSSFLYYYFGNSSLKLFPDKITIQDYNPPYNVEHKNLLPNKNLDADILYAGMTKESKDERGMVNAPNAFVVLKKRTDQRLLLFHFKVTSDALRLNADPIYSIDTISADHELAKASKYTINKDYDLLYYTKDNEIKYYDINYKRAQLLYTLPVGEEITYMHHAKYEIIDFFKKQIDKDRWFNKLVVATHSGGKYKVYLFDVLQYDEQRLDSNPIILEGDGCVADALYVSPALNNASFANQHN
jgi:hypothetical protein